MELRHLRYFIVVAEEGHFTRAAERLGMQQPPLSLQIRALENELGFELFRRHPKGAELTAGGHAFLKEAHAILDGLQQGAARAAQAARGAAGKLSIGFTSSAAAHPLIPKIVRAYRAAWPDVSLDFSEANAAQLGDAVAAGKVNVAFLRLPVSRPPGVLYAHLHEEEMLLVLPVGHPALPLKRGKSAPLVALTALKNEPFILVRRHGAPGMYSNLMDACLRAGFTPSKVIEVERMLTNISLVAAGAGVSAVPASMKGFHADSVVYCRIADAGPGAATKLSAPLTLASREHDISPAARHFLDLTRRVLAGASP